MFSAQRCNSTPATSRYLLHAEEAINKDSRPLCFVRNCLKMDSRAVRIQTENQLFLTPVSVPDGLTVVMSSSLVFALDASRLLRGDISSLGCR